MSTSTLGLFLRHLALSEKGSRLVTASDQDLLAAYEMERGQVAFTELMRRHGPMVLRTCRRVLGYGPDAEDAFQATFVLLARKAGSISKREAVGGWLHRVAYRTAADVLTGKIRRKAHERQASVMTPSYPDPSTEATWNEIRPILDAELDALPDQCRRLLIACYLQEKTHVEVATELGLPQGSIAWRLQRARSLLAARLARRGITVSTVLLAILLEDAAKGAGLPAVLLVHTLEAARTFSEQAAGIVSEHVARLVKGGLANMAKGSTHLSIALVGWVGLLGAGLIACQTLKAWPDQTPPTGETPVPPAAGLGVSPVERTARTDRFGDPLPADALTRLGTVRLRQATGVHSLAFTADGKKLITAGEGEPARLSDLATGRMLRPFGDRGDNRIYAAALSSNGRTLAARVAAGGLCLWDTATGTLLQRLKAEPVGAGSRVALAISPDGKTVPSVDGKPLLGGLTLHLWEVATGKELWAVNLGREGQQGVAILTYSADGKALIWTSRDGTLHLLDAATGKELHRWDDEKKRPIVAIVPAPDGRLFAAYSSRGTDGSVSRLWDVATGKDVWQRADEKGSIATAAFSPDGKILATGGYRGPLRLWDAATGKELRRCADCRSAVALAFSPDGKTLASGEGKGIGNAGDQTVHLWDVGSGREIRRTDDGHQATVCSVAFTADGKDIVSGSWEGSLRLWDAATGEQRQCVSSAGDERYIGGTISSIASAVSPDGKTLFSAAWDRIEPKSHLRVRRWDQDSGRELRGWSRELGKWAAHALVFSPDSKVVACTLWRTNPDQVRLWETATGKELSPVAGHYPAFSPDSKLLATAPFTGKEDEPGSFTLWEAATAKELCSVKMPEGRVHSLLFSPDGQMLATASTASNPNAPRNQPSTIHLWPLLRDESRTPAVWIGSPRLLAARIPPLADNRIHPNGFGAWAFSPDGRTLALSGEGGIVRLLETASGNERGRFTGHGGDVVSLSFSPDGRRLASGSRDTTILVWDVTGRLRNGRLPAAHLSAQEIEKLWAELAANNAGRARRAIWALAASPDQAVPYLQKRLRALAVDAKVQLAQVPQLLRDLDADGFAVRQKAKAQLEWLGAAAEPALRLALANSPSPEMRRSLNELLKGVEAKRQTLSGESLRGVRALEVLEHIGTREARATLKALTDGARTESSLTREAHAALERLDRAEQP